MEGILWAATPGEAGIAVIAPRSFEPLIERLAVHLAIEAVQVLLVRPGAGEHALKEAVADLRCAARYLAARGVRRFALAGAGDLCGPALTAFVQESHGRCCALFSPQRPLAIAPKLGGRPCLVACGNEDATPKAWAELLQARLLPFSRAPDTLGEVAGDLAAAWVPAVCGMLRA